MKGRRRLGYVGDFDDADDPIPGNPGASIEILDNVEPRWTGLFDAGGAKLFHQRNPIGFRFDR